MMQEHQEPPFHVWLKRCRGALGLTQKAFADHLGYSVETYRNIEQGETISDPFGERLITYLRLPVDQHAAFRTFIRTNAHPAPWSFLAHILLGQTQLAAADALSMPCPYPGMAPFTEAEHSAFFGREREVQDLLRRLHLHPLLTVIGPSGSGKSSLVNAGLLPALRQRQRLGTADWRIQLLRPGTTPLTGLRQAVDTPPSQTMAASGLTVALPEPPSISPSVPRRTLLVIDPFEELFTQAREEAQAVQMALLDLLNCPQYAVLLVVRADFYPELMHGPLWPIIQAQRVEVAPLDAGGLRQAIVRPAQALGVQVEPALVERLIADAADAPGVLPLMQETLVVLWEQLMDIAADAPDAPRVLSLALYEQLGRAGRTGVQVAMAQRADAVLAALSPAQQALTHRMFLRLIHVRDGLPDTRRQQPLAALSTADDDPALVEATVQILADRRLLIVSGTAGSAERMVDLAHEALIRGWDRLRHWVATSRADLHMQRRLATAESEWHDSGCDPSYLLSGVRLEQFAAWAAETALALNHNEQLYLASSLAQRDMQRSQEEQRLKHETALVRRSRRVLQALVVVLVIGLVSVSVFAGIARRNEAAFYSLALDEGGQAALREGNTDLALALAMEANRQDQPIPQTQLLLAEAAYAPGTRRVFSGHLSSVASVTFSPDRRTALSTSDDKTLILWDVATGRELRRFVGHDGIVWRAAFSPDGRTALSASDDKTLILWDVTTGQELRRYRGHSAAVQSVAFSPDGRLALSGAEDGTLILWDVASGGIKRHLRQHTGAVKEDGTLILWDVASGHAKQGLRGHTGAVKAVAFSPDGGTAISASEDTSLIVWDVASGQARRQLRGHTATVRDVAFSPDGRTVLSASYDTTLILWDVATGKQVKQPLTGHTGQVRSVAFSPDGRTALSASADTTMILWDLTTGKPLHTFRGHGKAVTGVAFSPLDGRSALSSSDDRTLRLWALDNGAQTGEFVGHTEGVWRVAFSPDGHTILSAAEDNTLILWDRATGQRLRTFKGHTSKVYGAAFSPDGRWILSGAGDNSLILWDVATGDIKERLREHTGAVKAVAFSSDGRRALSASQDQTLILWDLGDLATEKPIGKLIHRLTGHAGGVQSVVWSPDGRTALSGSTDTTLILWDVATGKELRRFSGHKSGVNSVAFSPDGRTALSGSADGTLMLWDLVSGQVIRRYEGHRAPVRDAVFSPDGRTILSGSLDMSVRLWRVDTFEDLITWTQENRYIPNLSCEQRQLYQLVATNCQSDSAQLQPR